MAPSDQQAAAVQTPPHAFAPDTASADLDAIPIRLPALMTALVAGAWITPAARRRHMDWFRAARGSHEARERETIARLACELGPGPLQTAARAAAAASLGLPHSGHVTASNRHGA